MTRPTPELILPAPAKLNLCLYINGRRADGYHELQTLFQFLDYADELHFTRRDDDQITLSPELPGVPPETNLIWRAAQLLRAHTGQPHLGCHVHLDKHLPMGGGIGGGSSDAATTLLALNHLWHLDLSPEVLAELGLRLGADVPVFVRGRAAWAEGVGERLTPANPPEVWYLVLKPACHVSTAEIFSHQGLTRDTPKIRIAPAFEAQPAHFRNDCQSLVAALYPEIKAALDWLSSYGNARLTGTGACVFASFDSEFGVLEALKNKPSSVEGFVAKGVNLSPLHSRLYGLIDAR